MKDTPVCLLLILTFLFLGQNCLGQTHQLTPELKKQTIEDLSALLPERYAYRETAQKLRDLLIQNLKGGKYEPYTSPLDFSIAVTSDLRSLRPDRHLALNYSPQVQTTNTSSQTQPTLSPEEQAKQASEFNRLMNYGFKDVKFLNGNVGYVKFDYFDSYLDYSAPVVDAVMGFLKNSDAIIIDLRYNGGGSPQMVNYIAGFFFDKRTLSGSSYDRLTDTTTKNFIEPQPVEKRLLESDLYILTSEATISAAEALAYDLKYLRKAVIVGEKSAGAANPGRTTRLNVLFTAFIPNRHGMNIVTGTNWEGSGVPVDIPVPAEDAVRIANIQALKKLQQKTSSTFKKERLGKYILFLEKTSPETILPRRTLLQYAGAYQGGRTLAVKNGELHYSRAAEAGGKLYSIYPDVFMLAEGDVTITFKRDKQNRVVGMESQWSLSDSPAIATKLK